MDDFKRLFTDELIPAYCDDPSRNWTAAGFRVDWSRIDPLDAEDFMRGWRAGLIEHQGRGLYRAPRSFASEQFFWEGSKGLHPRPFSLWVEPIVTVAAIARLHLDYGWPKEMLGMQSARYEFDFAAYPSAEATAECIAGEVKKSKSETDRLISLMVEFGSGHPSPDPRNRVDMNAYRKYKGLLARRSPVFWAVSPGRHERFFSVDYEDCGALGLSEATPSALLFVPPSASHDSPAR